MTDDREPGLADSVAALVVLVGVPALVVLVIGLLAWWTW